MKKQYYVYIMSNIARTLYVGVTNDLERRVYEHKLGLFPGFTAKYQLNRLVYFESGEDIIAAITKEKQIKGWLRSKKITLIESMNPEWNDLSKDLFCWQCDEEKLPNKAPSTGRFTDPSLRSG